MPFIFNVNGQQTTDNSQLTLGMLLCCELCSVPEPVEGILFVTSTSSVTDIIFSRKDAKERRENFHFQSLHHFITSSFIFETQQLHIVYF